MQIKNHTEIPSHPSESGYHPKIQGGAREMTKQLILAVLPEDPGSILITHVVVHNCLYNSSPGGSNALFGFLGHQVRHGAQTYMQGNTSTK